jgi:hypothetical protein
MMVLNDVFALPINIITNFRSTKICNMSVHKIYKYLFSIIICIYLGGNSGITQVFEGGLILGMTASQVDGDNYSGFDKIGLTSGAYIQKELTNKSALKMELRYTQRGAYKKQEEQNPGIYKLGLHYAELPIMFIYSMSDEVHIEAGFSPEIYLFHKEENEDGEFREEDYPKFHRFGLGSNAGIMYKVGKNIFIGARYTYSAIPIREHASGNTYLLNRGQYSNSLSFSVFYLIP